MIRLPAGDLAQWRSQARALLAAKVAPSEVVWEAGQGDMLAIAPPPITAAPHTPMLIPRTFFDLAAKVSLHRSPLRWQYLYQMAFRLVYENRHLLTDASDPDTLRLNRMARAIDHDVHKMHAFLRFQRVTECEEEFYTSWYEPAHLILEEVAPFFVNRFPNMCWSILTPDGSLHWDRSELAASAAIAKPPPREDELEAYWLTYYRSIFNPARVNERAMIRHMPTRFWRNLPEARLLPELLRTARITAGQYMERELGGIDTARLRSGKLRTLQDSLRGRASEILEPDSQARPGPGLDVVIDVERDGGHRGGQGT